MKNITAIDLFSGCGGLTEGLKQAEFKVVAAIDNDKYASETYRLNHPDVMLIEDDIRNVNSDRIKAILKGKTLNLLAGCPPCQGFSSIRRLNRKKPVKDDRNSLIMEYFRFVKDLQPETIMLENVPGILNYGLFKFIADQLIDLGYYLDYRIINTSKYSIPQSRRRFVLVGSRIGTLKIASASDKIVKVVDVLPKKDNPNDPLSKIYPKHTERIRKMIELIPKNGGSRKDLPAKYVLKCHKNENVGFADVYGRMSWDKVAPTMTGGCLSPSKGRFLHPEKNRCISAREAALLQTFPPDYKFPTEIPITQIALQIGNALPPKFCKIQAENIYDHIRKSNG